jgi:hypothetical protein
MSNMYVRRDTQAWVMQTWISFATAFTLCVVAVWNLPSDTLDRAFVAVGMFFVLSATFTLSKMMRDNQDESVDTPAWVIQVWASFGIAISLTAWGMFRMNVDGWLKAFLIGSCLFLLSSAFSLAKTLRDSHEADVIESAPSKKE